MNWSSLLHFGIKELLSSEAEHRICLVSGSRTLAIKYISWSLLLIAICDFSILTLVMFDWEDFRVCFLRRFGFGGMSWASNTIFAMHKQFVGFDLVVKVKSIKNVIQMTWPTHNTIWGVQSSAFFQKTRRARSVSLSIVPIRIGHEETRNRVSLKLELNWK